MIVNTSVCRCLFRMASHVLYIMPSQDRICVWCVTNGLQISRFWMSTNWYILEKSCIYVLSVRNVLQISIIWGHIWIFTTVNTSALNVESALEWFNREIVLYYNTISWTSSMPSTNVYTCNLLGLSCRETLTLVVSSFTFILFSAAHCLIPLYSPRTIKSEFWGIIRFVLSVYFKASY